MVVAKVKGGTIAKHTLMTVPVLYTVLAVMGSAVYVVVPM